MEFGVVKLNSCYFFKLFYPRQVYKFRLQIKFFLRKNVATILIRFENNS